MRTRIAVVRAALPGVAALAAALLAVALVAAGPALADPSPSASPTAVPALALTAAPSGLVAGAATALSASLGIPGATLELSAEAAGEATFTPLAEATTGADGIAAFTESPAVTTIYRVEFAGNADWAPAGAEATVKVAPHLTLTGPAAVFGWREVSLRITASPQHAGAAVMLQRRQGRVWKPFRRLTLGADSSAVARFRARRLGRFAYRVTMTADAQHVAGVSAALAVRVKSPNRFRVPLAAAHFIVVDESQYRLYYLEHGWVVRAFDCVLGRPTLPTPLGHFHIYAKDPRMGGPYGPRRMRYLRLYAIHGTNEPWLLRRFPRNYSHGCTRLSDAHILWLYPRCPVGTPVWNVP